MRKFRTGVALAVLLITTPAIAARDSRKEACDVVDAARTTFPTEQSPCTWGKPPSPQCKRFIDKWIAATTNENRRCDAESKP
jgi:hypothetical protein